MNEFTASNGVKLAEFGAYLDKAGKYSATLQEIHAARIEFYRHLCDEELGRWRYPPNPVYVVYPGWSAGEEQRFARVVNEHMGLSSVVYEHDRSERGDFEVGRAYFEAHPEPKPWHEAQPGEMWLLTTPDESDVPAVASSSENGHVILTAATHEAGGTQEFSTTSVYITAGRRIWPKS